MSFWLLTINCLFFVNLFVHFFIMKVSQLLCMRVLTEQLNKNVSKYLNILSELIHHFTLK